MLSALISSAGRKPAMLLAEQLAHESCVRPGPLVLGTALLKSPTPTEDRDRTVSRMFLPHYCGPRLYLHPISGGRRVMGLIDLPCGRRPISPIERDGGSRYGGHYALATQMLLDVHGGDPLRLRIVLG